NQCGLNHIVVTPLGSSLHDQASPLPLAKLVIVFELQDLADGRGRYLVHGLFGENRGEIYLFFPAFFPDSYGMLSGNKGVGQSRARLRMRLNRRPWRP